MMKVTNLENKNRRMVKTLDNFGVLEHTADLSVSPANAEREFFMGKMGVRKRQVVIKLDENHSCVVQAGAMQWMVGNVQASSGVKGMGDFLGKSVKGALTKETAVKPEYYGNGILVLEPTYKYILLRDVSEWGAGGITIEDGMFLACDANVKNRVTSRTNISSAALGGEGLFNLSLSGKGVVALESNVPDEELIEIRLKDDELKIDGNMAVCWSSGLKFTVEKSTKSLLGSAVSGEGFVNVYRGTGTVLMCPTSVTGSLQAATSPNSK